ncbi:hypothetical protein SEA_DULCIE_90 [Mycobacterium phage Dulcie]|nr:hypothetical protein SEA_DULCIE_90 [Mycobacterium phage Dulcie]
MDEGDRDGPGVTRGRGPGLPSGCSADAPADRVRGGHDHPAVEADLIAAPGLNLDAGLATEGDGLLHGAVHFGTPFCPPALPGDCELGSRGIAPIAMNQECTSHGYVSRVASKKLDA